MERGASRASAPPPKPRGRGSTREDWLEWTSALMIERDTVEVSLHEIAAYGKSNAALVKYYFGNKEGLLLALLERDVGAAAEAFGRLVATDMPALQKMEHHLSGLMRTYHRRPYLNRLVRHVIRDDASEESRRIAARTIKPLCDFYARLIAQGVAEGAFRPVDPMLFYFSAVGACDQMFSARGVLKAVYGVDQIDERLRRAFVSHTVALLTTGVVARPGERT